MQSGFIHRAIFSALTALIKAKYFFGEVIIRKVVAMAAPDPCVLDTLAFSGLDEAEMRRRALSSRAGLDLFEHELSFIRRRLAGRDRSKPSLIVLPDGPATIESYDAFVEQLSDRFNIALIEMPGFGFSFARHPDALDFEQSAQIVAAAIRDLDMPKAVLVGACVQGLIAARVAEIVPDHLAGLIIAQTADFAAERVWSGEVLDAQGNLARPFEGQVSFRLARERATVDWWAAFVAGPKLPLEAFQKEARSVLRCGCSNALASLMQKWNALDPLPEFRPQVPAAIIWGLADKSHTATDRRTVLRYAPDATYIERDDIGHFPDLEAPELIADTAADLLSRGSQADPAD